MPRNPKPPCRRNSLVVWGIPKELRLKFKARCAKYDLNMKDVIAGLMERFISGEGKYARRNPPRT